MDVTVKCLHWCPAQFHQAEVFPACLFCRISSAGNTNHIHTASLLSIKYSAVAITFIRVIKVSRIPPELAGCWSGISRIRDGSQWRSQPRFKGGSTTVQIFARLFVPFPFLPFFPLLFPLFSSLLPRHTSGYLSPPSSQASKQCKLRRRRHIFELPTRIQATSLTAILFSACCISTARDFNLQNYSWHCVFNQLIIYSTFSFDSRTINEVSVNLSIYVSSPSGVRGSTLAAKTFLVYVEPRKRVWWQ